MPNEGYEAPDVLVVRGGGVGGGGGGGEGGWGLWGGGAGGGGGGIHIII